MKTVKLECTSIVPLRLLAGIWQALQQLCHFPESRAIMPLPSWQCPCGAAALCPYWLQHRSAPI